MMEIQPWPELQAALPPLSDEERRELFSGIVEFGQQYPILVMTDGRIIDGHHRWEVLGDAVAFEEIVIDEADGFALGLVLNLARRQLGPDDRPRVRKLFREHREAAKRAIKVMDDQGMTQEQIGEAMGLDQSRVSQILAEEEESVSNMNIHIAHDAPTDRRSRYRKIPYEDADNIRARKSAGESWKTIAKDYGVVGSALPKFLERAARQERGEVRSRNRFSEEQEEEIEWRYRKGEARPTLATEYGCDPSTISNIIRRVRARWEGGRPPASSDPPAPPENVVSLAAKQRERRTSTPVPERRHVPPEAIQADAERWLKMAQKVNTDQLAGLISRYDRDALVAALTTSKEGEILVRNLEEMATAFRSFASMIRRGNAGQENSRDGIGQENIRDGSTNG